VPAQGIEKNVRAPRRALLAVPSLAEPRRAMSRRSVSGPPVEGQHRTIDWPGGFSSWQCEEVCSTELFRAYFTRRFICVSSSAMCGSSGIPPAERSKTIRSRLQLVAASPLGREGPVDCTCWRPAHWTGRGLSTAAGGGLGPNRDWSRGRLDPTCNDNGIASFDLVRHHRANGSIPGMVAATSDPILFVASSRLYLRRAPPACAQPWTFSNLHDLTCSEKNARNYISIIGAFHFPCSWRAFSPAGQM
jgi:hypothetical protein